MDISMARGNFLQAIFRNLGPLVLMCQIITDLIQQVGFALIKCKILARNKEIQKIRLIIGQQKSACPHNVKGAQGNAAEDAPQGAKS